MEKNKGSEQLQVPIKKS